MRAAIIVIALVLASSASAQSPDISARRLLSSWKDDDPSMRLFAEVIASAFASGFSWGGKAGGKEVFCASQEVKGRDIMSALERFLHDNADMAERPYGQAMAATLTKAFPCQGL